MVQEVVQHSHSDGEVAALLLCSGEGDGERGLSPLHLVHKLDPELVMIHCREGKPETEDDKDRSFILSDVWCPSKFG